MTALASSPLHSFLVPFGAIFAAVGLIFLLIGVGMAVPGRRFKRRAERAEGQIVGHDANDPALQRVGRGVRVGGAGLGQGPFVGPGGIPPSGNAIIYRPTVAFETRDGRQVRATSPFGSNPRPGRVGETVTVLYDPRDPQRFRVDSLTGRGTCLEVAFILIGGVFAAFGVAVLVLAGH